MARHRREAVPQVQSTLAKLSLCRTAALGGRRFRCGECNHQCLAYNSCGDRHCPQCAGAKRANWLTSTSKLLLPGIDYFQVVFTMPDKLSGLALGNRREIYNLLFRSAWDSLRGVIAEEQGFEAAAAMVLHTWNQKLEPHAHVHALVPGGGPSLSEDRQWVRSSLGNGPGRRSRRGKQPYLVDADALRARFRQVFLDGLKRLHGRGLLKLDGQWSHLQNVSAFAEWLEPFQHVKWVTYIEPPPTQHAAPEHVLKYLARYLTGGPISDRRLISHENGDVTFWARTGKTAGGQDAETRPYTLSGTEFVRRWSLHILPKGFVKTRRYGGYSNHHRQRYIAECQDLLPTHAIECRDDSPQPSEPPITELAEVPCCPRCGAPLLCIAATERRSWFTVMNSPARPNWYDDG